MALTITFKETQFGVGDRVRVVQKIKDEDKFREAFFEGMVIGIKGRSPGKTITVRKIAEGGIGVERIFPLNLPSIDRITVVKRGVEGVRRAKLYYTRTKPPTEVEMIYKRSALRNSPAKKATKRVSAKKTSKKSR
jgi:large subunit ribosomal protein L19